MGQLYCLGDSLTFGLGVRRQERWTNLVDRETDCQILNLGCNGDTTGGMLVRLQKDILSGHSTAAGLPQPPRVLLMGGSNDIFYSGSAAAARGNMGAMIHQTMSAGFEPVVGIPLPVDPALAPARWAKIVDFYGAAELLREYAVWLKDFSAAFSVSTVDFRVDFLKDDDTVAHELFLDGLHPNRDGHRKMADRLAAFLRQKEGLQA